MFSNKKILQEAEKKLDERERDNWGALDAWPLIGVFGWAVCKAADDTLACVVFGAAMFVLVVKLYEKCKINIEKNLLQDLSKQMNQTEEKLKPTNS